MSLSHISVVFLIAIVGWYFFKTYGKALTIVIAIATSIVICVGVLLLSFQSVNSRTQIATIRAVPVENKPHTMIVSITTFDHFKAATTQTYELPGDRWFLQSQVVEYQPWVLFIGLKSGYHLQRLEGEFDSDTPNSKAIQLGNWSWFNTLENNVKLFFPVIKSAYGNAVIDPADGRTYGVYVDPQGDMSAIRQ